MSFQVIYRISFYLMLNLATLVLSIDATDDNPIAMIYPPAVALASIVAFLTVDRNPRWAMSRTTANFLALLSTGLSLAEYNYDINLRLLAAAHWLVYLQVIKMFLPKTVEDDWFLFLVGLVQVLVGGVMSQSDKVGVALFGWALMTLWVLSLFALRREAIRLRAVPLGSSNPSADRDEPYRGLIDPPFVFASARVAGTTLALGGLIFLAMPRFNTMNTSQSSGSVGKHLSGFDDEVQLGQLGEILENDSVVMSIELSDREGRRISPAADSEFRWRGLTLDTYVRGRWKRPRLIPIGLPLAPAGGRPEPDLIRQAIKLEPTDSPILFGLRPMIKVVGSDNRYEPELNQADGALFRLNTATVTVDYTVESTNRPDAPQRDESYPGRDYLETLETVPPSILARIRPIAEAQVEAIDEDDHRGRAEALAEYLKARGGFLYTLSMDVIDPDLDPVVDFLVNRKSGHCEYFASALTLLLRSIGIPARMVNGFKGGDYNSMSGAITVRQKHAHSWVEALIGETRGGRDRQPIWLTLDPTPADQRNSSVDQVGGVASRFRLVTDLVRYIWIFYVVGFNAERQDRFLYAPVRALIAEARRGFSIMGQTLRDLLRFPSVESFFSLRGFAVSFVALMLLVGLVALLRWVGPRAWRRLRWARAERSSGSAAILFYRRLLTLLAQYGLERPPAETPREFARRASIFLAGHGSGAEAVADVPPLVVEAFYKIRFGEHTLVDEDFILVNARLDALEARLHPPRSS